MSTDTLELIEMDLNLDIRPVCEDEAALDGNEAHWITRHGNCSYLICTVCKIEDEEVVNECANEGTHAWCGHCHTLFHPDELKFIHL